MAVLTGQAGKARNEQESARRAAPQGFPRPVRLLRRAAFTEVYDKGRRHFSSRMTVFYVLHEPQEGTAAARVGITVSRALGGAVVRNLMKRRLRDLVRRNLGVLNYSLTGRGLAADVVINPKKTLVGADHAELQVELQRAFQVIAGAVPDAQTEGPNIVASRKRPKRKT